MRPKPNIAIRHSVIIVGVGRHQCIRFEQEIISSAQGEEERGNILANMSSRPSGRNKGLSPQSRRIHPVVLVCTSQIKGGRDEVPTHKP